MRRDFENECGLSTCCIQAIILIITSCYSKTYDKWLFSGLTKRSFAPGKHHAYKSHSFCVERERERECNGEEDRFPQVCYLKKQELFGDACKIYIAFHQRWHLQLSSYFILLSMLLSIIIYLKTMYLVWRQGFCKTDIICPPSDWRGWFFFLPTANWLFYGYLW